MRVKLNGSGEVGRARLEVFVKPSPRSAPPPVACDSPMSCDSPMKNALVAAKAFERGQSPPQSPEVKKKLEMEDQFNSKLTLFEASPKSSPQEESVVSNATKQVRTREETRTAPYF